MSAIRDAPTNDGVEREETGIKTHVVMSSGDLFYVDAPPSRVAKFFDRDGLLKIGSRWINPLQIVQLQAVREVSSIHTPERLED